MAGLGNGAYSMMSKRVRITRPSAIVNKVRGEPDVIYVEVPCTNLLPVSADILVRMPDKVASELLQVFIGGDYEIREGDSIIVDGAPYVIRTSDPWPLRDRKLILLVVDNTKVR